MCNFFRWEVVLEVVDRLPKTFRLKSAPETILGWILFICFLKRAIYDSKNFVNLIFVRTFAAPQNMQGVVTS